MKLVFLCPPVKNIKESVILYRENLRFEEAWREKNHTVALKLPNTVHRPSSPAVKPV